jgi:hypothetical protein
VQGEVFPWAAPVPFDFFGWNLISIFTHLLDDCLSMYLYNKLNLAVFFPGNLIRLQFMLTFFRALIWVQGDPTHSLQRTPHTHTTPPHTLTRKLNLNTCTKPRRWTSRARRPPGRLKKSSKRHRPWARPGLNPGIEQPEALASPVLATEAEASSRNSCYLSVSGKS